MCEAAMTFCGLIRAQPNGDPLDYDRWCALVRRRTDRVQRAPRNGTNPKTGEPVTIYPHPDAASVVIDRQIVGSVYWSMSEGNEIIVIGQADVTAALGRK